MWTLLDATSTPPRFLPENLSLFELGNRFVMYALDLAVSDFSSRTALIATLHCCDTAHCANCDTALL